VAKAEQIYQAVLQKHPNFGPALNNLGQIYYGRGEESVAIQYFQKAVKVKTSEAYANLAVLQRNRALKGDMQALQGAIENVHRALAVDSFNIEAYGTLALALYDHAKNPSQLEMARLICAQAIKVNPKYPPIYNILGLVLLRMGKVTPALREFRKAAALNPDYLEAQMNIGAVVLGFRDYESAAKAFTKVLSLNPDKKIKMQALIGLGVALRGQRKFDEAMQKYNEAKALSPNNPAIAYNMGILVQDYQFNAANPDAAIAQLARARAFLQQYASNGRDPAKMKDVKRRLKNIDEMIPMLREQKKMMEEMKKMQQQQPPPPAPAAAAAPAPAAKPAAAGTGK
jgi:tetratricopeptide (TPR) repeat protein